MDAYKWLEVASPFYDAVGATVEELSRHNAESIDPDLLRLRRDELADKFADAQKELAKAAALAKNNSIADLSRRGLLNSSLKDANEKGIDDRAANELSKMHKEYNRVIERIAILERGINRGKAVVTSSNQKPIFISHATADKDLVDRFVELLISGINVNRDDIFCTSLEGMGIPAGENFVQFIKSQIQSPRIVLMVITPSYLKSKFCLCEMGACWALSHKGIPLLADPISFDDLEAVLVGTQAIRLSDSSAMSGLRDLIVKEMKLTAYTALWEKKRDDFISELPTVPPTQEIIVSQNEPVIEQSQSSVSIPDRIVKLIKFLEDGIANTTPASRYEIVQRLFRLANERLKDICEESTSQRTTLGHLPTTMQHIEEITSARPYRQLDALMSQSNKAITMLKEHHAFLTLDA